MVKSTCLYWKSSCDLMSWEYILPPWPSSIPRGCLIASLISVSLSLAFEPKCDEDREWKPSAVSIATFLERKEWKRGKKKVELYYNLSSEHQWMSCLSFKSNRDSIRFPLIPDSSNRGWKQKWHEASTKENSHTCAFLLRYWSYYWRVQSTNVCSGVLIHSQTSG